MATRSAPRPSLWRRLVDAVGRRFAAPQQRVFAGAATNRLTSDWFTTLLSADEEIKGDLRRLRGASRSLVRDNPYGARYPQMVCENVVGHKGLQLQMRLGTTRGTPAKYENARVEAAFCAWGDDPSFASADGRQTWVELQQAAMRSVVIDGEVLVRHIRGADNPFGYAVQILDPDLLDHEFGGHAPVRLANGNEVRLGVEVEPRFGRAVAYHLWTSHPADSGRERRRERVPAEDIEHLYLVLRPGQTRGVPWFAPVLISAKMRGAYEEAAITAARIGASSMAAVTFDPEKAGGVAPMAAGHSSLPMEVEPGRFMRLAPGEALQNLNFDYPSQDFGPFISHIDRSIANGLHVAYTSLTGDLSGVNYSSIRAGLLSERDFYRGLQTWLASHLHRRVFAAWAQMAALTGWIAPTRVTEIALSATWKPRGWAWVDPQSDVEAGARAVQEGFTTRSDIAADRGNDFEDVLARLAEEQAMAEALGLTLGAPVSAPARAPADDAPDDEPEDTDEDPDDQA